MTTREIARLVWLNITQNKFKVVLTSIGIVMGAATIVLVIAVGRGGQMDVADQFKNLSAASIEVSTPAQSSNSRSQGGGGMPGGGMPGGTTRSGAGGGFSGGGMPSGGTTRSGGAMPGAFGFGGFGGAGIQTVRAVLTEEDAEDIAFFVPDVAQSTILVNGKKEVLGGNMEEASQYTVAGVKPEYQAVSNLTVYLGEFITSEDEENRIKSCVLGYSLAESMFGSLEYAYDSAITIEDTTFTVVGVLDKMGTVSSGISPDETVYIPYSGAIKYIFGRTAEPQINIVATDANKVQEVITNLNILLDENYPGATFTVSDAGSKMEAAQQSSRTLSMLLIVIAAIVFVVGGIGIMNVLFVSVKERTSEIGVLKALGMCKRDILMEFLLEATAISAFGGAAGIALSLVIMPLASQFGVRMEPVLWGYLAAFIFAMLCGTLFGIYPAYRASKLAPVEALRES